MADKMVSISFGFLAQKMNKQLRAFGFRLPRNHCADDVNIAISTLALGGFITESQKHQARQKLVKRILRDAIPLRKPKGATDAQ